MLPYTRLTYRFYLIVYNAEGANVGINLGKVAGATKPDHIHVQIVPRWYGDTTWIHIIGKTSVLAHDLHNTYAILKEKFDAYKIYIDH